MQSKLKAVLAVILSSFITSESFALLGANIGNEVPSARTAGQGYVGVAGQNEDPTTVYSNPGAITNLKGTQATFGFHYENVRASYESDAGMKTGSKKTHSMVPNFSMTQS